MAECRLPDSRVAPNFQGMLTAESVNADPHFEKMRHFNFQTYHVISISLQKSEMLKFQITKYSLKM